MISTERHQPAGAGPPRIRLEPIWRHNVILDGDRWPRSYDPEVELPALVRALDGAHGPVVRLLLSAAGWIRRPHHIVVGNRMVSLRYFSDQPPATLTAICADGALRTFLVVPADSAGPSRSVGATDVRQ
jgi:hypothetical protein